ncbi:MAG: molybdopterin-binding protein [Anaerolineales bacterium]|nr:molybdopterin-binding protein [Anaerolineales bacterium]
MKFGPVPLDRAEGKILGHNIAGPDGKRLLRKGRPLTADDIAALHAIGRTSVYVAELTADDVDEDTAARRVAQAVSGSGLRLPGAASGRANLLSTVLGILRVDAERLARLNELEGITLATLASHSTVRPRQIVGTVKIIPFAVPEATVQAAEALASGGALVWVDALTPQPVSLIFSGSISIREKLADDFTPLTERVTALGSHIISTDYIPLEDESGEAALAEALSRCRAAGARLIVLAGETAIMDRHDIVPRAVERAGGRVEALGAPVDPGNLLMLAYLEEVPILGAPGCARSRKMNIVDWVLPRLLAGDRLTRRDILTLGHGGLLEDVPERPMSRNKAE